MAHIEVSHVFFSGDKRLEIACFVHTRSPSLYGGDFEGM